MTAPTLVNVSEDYIGADGQPRAGSVSFTSTRVVSAADQVVVPASTIRAPIAGDGSITVNLIASDDPAFTPLVGPYLVVENFRDGGGTTFLLTVPIAAAATGLRIDGGSGAGTGTGGSTLIGYGFFIDSSGAYLDTAAIGGLPAQLDGATGDIYLDTTVTAGTVGALIDSTTGQPYVNV